VPGELVKVFTAPNLAVAEMIRQVLESEGVPAFTRPPRLSPYIGVDDVDILVAEEQAGKARSIIAGRLEAGEGLEGGDPAGAVPERAPEEEEPS